MSRKPRTSDVIVRCLFFILLGAVGLYLSKENYSEFQNKEVLREHCVLEVDATIEKVTDIKNKGKDKYGDDSIISEHYSLFFTYEVNGQEYCGAYDGNGSPGYKEGDTFYIYCNPDDPPEWISSTDVNLQPDRLSNGYGLRKIGIILIGFGVLRLILFIIGKICKKSRPTQKGRN